MTKKLIIGILVGGALGATVAYYRHRFLERFGLQVDSVQDHEDLGDLEDELRG